EIDVASNGGIIPFTVTAASGTKTSNWLKINVANQLPSLQTSGVALSGSYVPIYVSIDYNALIALNVGPYAGTITFTNNASGAVGAVFSVSINVSAGPPTITSIFPSSVVAAVATGRVPPVITIYGDNFFSNSSVQLTPDGAQPLPALAPTLLSRQVLQATLNPSYLTKPGTFTLTVANPSTLTDPTPQQYAVPFTVTDGSVPAINAIFGQSIGPGTVFPAQASTAFPATFPLLVTPTVAAGISSVMYEVLFKFGANSASLTAPVIAAPIIMVSSNQINAVVPVPPSSPSVYTLVAPNAWVQVVETTGTGLSATVVTTSWFPVTFVPEVPGVFTFGGLGLGQAAVLNYDAT